MDEAMLANPSVLTNRDGPQGEYIEVLFERQDAPYSTYITVKITLSEGDQHVCMTTWPHQLPPEAQQWLDDVQRLVKRWERMLNTKT